jgi:hypothetical protein
VLSGLIDKFFHNVYTPLGDLLDIMTLLNNGVNFNQIFHTSESRVAWVSCAVMYVVVVFLPLLPCKDFFKKILKNVSRNCLLNGVDMHNGHGKCKANYHAIEAMTVHIMTSVLVHVWYFWNNNVLTNKIHVNICDSNQTKCYNWQLYITRYW